MKGVLGMGMWGIFDLTGLGHVRGAVQLRALPRLHHLPRGRGGGLADGGALLPGAKTLGNCILSDNFIVGWRVAGLPLANASLVNRPIIRLSSLGA